MTVFGKAKQSNEIVPQVCAASVFGQMGSPGVAGYCASKAAVIGLVRTAAKENPHVRMNCIAPGKAKNTRTLACILDPQVSLHLFHFHFTSFLASFLHLHYLFFLMPVGDERTNEKNYSDEMTEYRFGQYAHVGG